MRADRPYEWLVSLGHYLDSREHFPDEGVAHVVFPGGSPAYDLFVPLAPGAGRDVYLHHVREPFSSAVYAATLRTLGEDTTVYEIGANVGYYLVPGAKLASKIIAFEPQHALHRYLRTNLAINRLSNVSLHAQAIWSSRGSLRMTSPEKHNLSRVDPRGTVSVEAIVPEDLPRPDTSRSVLRMDIEGGEQHILSRLVTHLSPDYIFVELHPNIIGTDKAVSLALSLVDRGYLPLTFLEPLPETIGLPFAPSVWRLTGIGPQFHSLSREGLLRGLFSAFSRGWVVHTHWYRDFSLLLDVVSHQPWTRIA